MYLVTRPQPNANATAARLRRRGLGVVVAPQMQAQPTVPRTVTVTRQHHVIVTSLSAARALKHWHELHACAALAVGDATAKQLRRSGFKKVTSAQGNVAALQLLIIRTLKPARHTLVLAGAPSTGRPLAAALRAAGFTVRRISVYRITPVTRLLPEAAAFLRNKKSKGVLFYSPRTARVFAAAVKTARLQACTKRLTAYCLSKAVAASAQHLPWKHVVIASEPTENSLLKRIRS